MFKIAFELLLIYFLYKFIFDFIIPIAKTTSQVKKQFGDMQEKMRGFNQNNHNTAATNTENSTPQPKPSKEDYIEYEEIK